jgi:3'-5' exoribonuclease
MRRLYLNACSAGDILDDVYVVSGKQFAPTSNGKFYIKTFVSDRSSQVTARIWGASREMFNALPDGGFVKLRARIENYQNNLQCIIENFSPVKEGAYDVADLLPTTKKDVGQMYAKLTAILGSIRNVHLGAVVRAYTSDAMLMESFKRAPAAQTFHHAYIGGLLEHTLNAMEVGDAVCRFYPALNRDLVVAGIFLHDLAKTWELKYETAFGYTDGGQLVGHIVKSAMWVEDKAREAARQLGQEIPRPLIDVLQHIILSHHGELEFGSPKTPATPEALAVHMIEAMDAKFTMALAVTRGEAPAGCEGNWTEYLKPLNGRFYRPDVAPGEMPAEAEEPAPVARDEPPRGPGGAPAANHRPPAPAGRPVISNPLFESVPNRGK